MFLLVFCLLIPICSTDLTGLHYLFMINCSSPGLYISQGPYLFSHHWPFALISVLYDRQINPGTCYQDGSLYFVLNNTKFCFGLYENGQAELFCRYENDENDDYCFLDMKTSDGSRLSCM
jgi:hypothetical protein